MLVRLEDRLSFDKFFKNISPKPYQIEKKDYLKNGKFPIVDQGQKFIVGYSNNEDKLFVNTPIIIFGDHTRILKYIDFDFIIGADGTKILTPIDDSIDTKYAYYQLLYTKIENLGYSRHYKVLKEKTFIKPPLTKQKAIAKKLDKAKELIELRKDSIKKLDELSKAVFVDMFGDPVENEMEWDVDKLENFCNFENGDRSSKYPSSEDLVDEGVLFLSSREIVNFKFKPSKSQFITEEKYQSLSQGHCKLGDILMTLRGNGRGKCCIFEGKYNKGFINAQMIILRPYDKIINLFFIELIKNVRMFNKLLQVGSGSAQPQITGSALKSLNIILPPLDLQNKFAKTIQKIEAQKSLYEEALEKLEYGFEALLSESFG